jgi:hypothetical protein
MKYFNALQRKATKHLPDLNTLSLKADGKTSKAHYSSIMQVFRWTPFDTENVAQTYGNLILLEQLKMDTNPFHFSLKKRWHDSWFH